MSYNYLKSKNDFVEVCEKYNIDFTDIKFNPIMKREDVDDEEVIKSLYTMKDGSLMNDKVGQIIRSFEIDNKTYYISGYQFSNAHSWNKYQFNGVMMKLNKNEISDFLME